MCSDVYTDIVSAPVSYTHLDVYKRQTQRESETGAANILSGKVHMIPSQGTYVSSSALTSFSLIVYCRNVAVDFSVSK